MLYSYWYMRKRNRVYVTLPIQDRFWPKVDKSGDCWLWTGAKTPFGHGVMAKPGGGAVRTHRVSWEMHRGTIPEGLCVLHRCDVPACVNPDHLFLGDRDANNKDMQAKGRCDRVKRPRGENHGCAKLTEDAVRQIRERRNKGETYASIARDFGVSLQTIFRTCHHNWQHVA
jgi:hypothetical protein